MKMLKLTIQKGKALIMTRKAFSVPRMVSQLDLDLEFLNK